MEHFSHPTPYCRGVYHLDGSAAHMRGEDHKLPNNLRPNYLFIIEQGGGGHH
jgi:hypothetical protein